MRSPVDVLIIGAGPYGLSLAAHLAWRGVGFRIVGEPMSGWKHHMPPGMVLKSQPWASSLASPRPFSIGQYYAENGLAYHPLSHYIPLENFISYGEEFRRRHILTVERKILVNLSPLLGRFSAVFDDGDVIDARRVVLAVGLAAFKHLPAVVDQLPGDLISHSSEYGPLEKLRGRRAVVVGTGSSAVDLAVLLREGGTDVTLLGRADQIHWGGPVTPRSLYQRLGSPESGIGTGWPFMVAVYAPWLYQRVPDDHLRLRFAYTGGLGPLAGFPMRERFEGKLPTLFERQIHRVTVGGRGVDLDVTSADGEREVVSADHVVFATGYKIDVNRLQFLDPAILERIKLIETAPRLTRHYESSVPGLHFIGPAAAPCFGPQCRFVHGTTHPARHLARFFSRVLPSGKTQ